MLHQRRLDHDEKTEAAKLLEMKVNKKVLQQRLTRSTGKVVTLKDITNIQTEIRQSSDSNNLDTLVQSLKIWKVYHHCIKSCLFFSIHPGSTVEIYTNDENELTGLFSELYYEGNVFFMH